MEQQNIRNFSIIAHIDHGKSTLADRILEITGGVPDREMNDRYLDRMELEQERGVTIKLQTIRLQYELKKENYLLNLIDTPGHVDFSYEVSRSLASCEGAILLVDATQGIQAQTLSHYYKAKKLGLKIIPVINKIDVASPEMSLEQINSILRFSPEEVLQTSGKTGQGVEKLLEEIIQRIPSPSGKKEDPLRGLVFDSFYDSYKGVVLLVKIHNGNIAKEKGFFPSLKLMSQKTSFDPIEIGYLQNKLISQNQILTGEVGYIATGVKDIRLFQVGDTVTTKENPAKEPLPGYKKIKPRIFAGIYPDDRKKYLTLKESLNKLVLNDASLSFSPENSPLLGNGFRCGFLGQFHLEITSERLLREFELQTVITIPSVEYEINLTNGQTIKINNASQFPDPSQIKQIMEPWIQITVYCPQTYMGNLMELIKQSRGILQDTQTIGQNKNLRLKLIYDLPLNELLDNFFGKLKSVSAGYASLDYEFLEYRPGKIVCLDIYLNKELIAPLSFITPLEKAETQGRKLVEKLKDLLPRQQFAVPIQASIGGKIIARETLQAYRKDVTAKLYGGDRTRKDKLLEQQKKGKKRLKASSKITIPPEVFKKISTQS